MVHFVETPERDDSRNASAARIAPVSYLPGAEPGMPRRHPLDGSQRERTSSVESVVRSEPGDESADPIDVEQKALRALARQSMTERELSSFLRESGLDSDDSLRIAERFIELGYINDRRVADELVYRLSELKGQSRAVVSRSLSARGIPSDVVSEALSEIDDDTEREAAIELAVKRGGQLSGLDDATFDRRLTGYLARRGYGGSIVRDAVSAARSARGQRVRFR